MDKIGQLEAQVAVPPWHRTYGRSPTLTAGRQHLSGFEARQMSCMRGRAVSISTMVPSVNSHAVYILARILPNPSAS